MTEPGIDFDSSLYPKEKCRHYIPASPAEIDTMMQTVGVSALDDLFAHLPKDILFGAPPPLPEELPYDEVAAAMASLAAGNRTLPAFLGDGLPWWHIPDIASDILGLRSLTTSYTPYQPERSQGTLISHWIYQCTLAALTGFDAVNASLYDRSTAIYEAMLCALRVHRKGSRLIVAGTLYPGDIDVLRTLSSDVELDWDILEVPAGHGRIDPSHLERELNREEGAVAGVVFPQVNHFGILEPVDELTDLCTRAGALSIAVIDPILLGPGGLKPPSLFGDGGVDLVVGEAQHLALEPTFGGPGLGLFAVRSQGRFPQAIRQAPGRFVGKSRDSADRDCRVMVLSTREQHIRKEKATSNICSNQAFLATLAGATLLQRGDEGLAAALESARSRAIALHEFLTGIPGVKPAFPDLPFFNEFTLELNQPPAKVLAYAREEFGILAGHDISGRNGDRRNLIKICLSDVERDGQDKSLRRAFSEHFGAPGAVGRNAPEIPSSLKRTDAPGIPTLSRETLADYYQQLADLNISPEKACYPLGSCTMKYNPYLNDWAAGLEGFRHCHPQAPMETVQGCLAVLHEIQEWFATLTGLAGVTTQPVAGAQGELVGLKLFQAYHRDRGEGHRRIVFIPKSAHGTNFATAIMAGCAGRPEDEQNPGGIVLLEADACGCVDLDDLQSKLDRFGPHLAGIMVTNPNTGGVFETTFREVADRVHRAGGLVYMDGANMNAIAGWTNLGAMGVDAVHNNLHKTWTIPHGGGGPGDAIVAVSEPLIDYLPGMQIIRNQEGYTAVRPEKSIGTFHRHWGNFAHKIRALTYLKRLGREGVPRMSGMAVLAARYVHQRLKPHFKTLPAGTGEVPRMHEFIITISEEDFNRLEEVGIPRAQAIPRIGKLFLDFGYHAPTVAFPEVFGLMIEPTESYTLAELDRFCEATIAIGEFLRSFPEIFREAPHFTPIDRVDEVGANRSLCLSEPLLELPELHPNRIDPQRLLDLPVNAIVERLRGAVTAG